VDASERAHDVGRLVGGAVVDDDSLPWAAGLIDDALAEPPEVLGLVPADVTMR
jgi:hypothetical protein